MWAASSKGSIGSFALAYGSWWEKEHKGWGNAARHGYWQAALAIEYDGLEAGLIGYVHEFVATEEEKIDSAMDVFNNEVGRNIGLTLKKEGKTSRDDIKGAVDEALKNGDFITSPDDPRLNPPEPAPTPTPEPAPSPAPTPVTEKVKP